MARGVVPLTLTLFYRYSTSKHAFMRSVIDIRAFQDVKSHAGFDHYQVRGWRALHHHLAMVFLVLLVMLETCLAMGAKLPKISCGVVVNMLRSMLPSKLADPLDMAMYIANKYACIS